MTIGCFTPECASYHYTMCCADPGSHRRSMEYFKRGLEAAERLGVSVNTLDMERSAGHLAYIQRKPGGKVWITEDALTEYLARVTHQARSERKSGVETYRRRRVTP